MPVTDIVTADEGALAAQRVITRTLDRLGWEMQRADVTVDADGRAKAHVTLRRADGLEVTLFGGPGGAYIERDSAVWVDGPRRYSGRWRHTFLGRTRYEGARAAFRALAHHIADNPAPKLAALPRPEVAAALRLMLRSAEPPAMEQSCP